MAVWGAKKKKYDCEKCQKIKASKPFQKGARVRVAEMFDCNTCEVMKHQPIHENENIVELYNALPGEFTAKDVEYVFHLFEVPEGLRFDYYQRIVFLHAHFMKAREKQLKKTSTEQDDIEKWKEEKRLASRGQGVRRVH